MRWNAEELETAIRDEGGAVGVVRSAEEWRAHPVGRALFRKPIVEVTKIGDSVPFPLPTGLPASGRPWRASGSWTPLTSSAGRSRRGPWLSTARTSCTSAGSMIPITRTGAWTDLGKRAAYCDFRDQKDRADFFRLLHDADVFTCSYLGLDRKGRSPQRS